MVGLTLAGCGTKYQEMGFTGGVAAEQMSANVYRIKSRGNGYTSNSTIQDYVLLKAAETTKEAVITEAVMLCAYCQSPQGLKRNSQKSFRCRTPSWPTV